MSGNVGIRGYIIQTLICILDALETDNKWLSVTLEPLDESEKVDIKWKYENNYVKLSQVKSSQNILKLSDAKIWSSELESKSPNASEYELVLVGTPEEKLLKEKKIGKVNIIGFKPIDTDFLIDQASTKIDKYYERKGKTKISSKVRELIIGSLNTRFGTSSILGKEIKRDQFDEQLLDWIIAIQKEVERNPLAIFSVQDSEDNNDIPFSHRVTKKILELIGWTQFGEK